MIQGSAVTYRVFVRDWWRRADGYSGKLSSTSLHGKVPYSGAPKRTLARRCTEEEALAVCQRYNSTHKPGWRSRKAEYESE